MPKYNNEILQLDSSVKKNWDDSELYSKEDAIKRAFDIGCTGCKSTIINSMGEVKYRPCSSDSVYNRIMKEIHPISRDSVYSDFFQDENLYDVRDSIFDSYPRGFDYKDRIFEKTLSPIILQNPNSKDILKKIERVIYSTIESIKRIRNFTNWTVSKNNKNVN